MATTDDFFPYVQPVISACPNPLVRGHLLRAIRAFCRRSAVWTLRLPALTLVQGQAAYALTVPAEAVPVTVREVFGESGPLDGKAMGEVVRLLPNWLVGMGRPLYFVTDQVTEGVELYPLPDSGQAGKTLVPLVSLAPTAGATTVPDFLLDRYAEAVAAGALDTLQRIKDQPWTNVGEAERNRMLFEMAIANARIEQEHGRVAGSLSVVPRRFGR